MSRIPIREALRSLSSEGLVVLKPGHGARVVELNRIEMVDLYRLRLALEPGLASEIVDRISPAEIRDLGELARAMENSSDRDTWSSLNYEFHRRMYVVVERPQTMRVILQIMSLVEPYSRIYVHLRRNLDRVSREHAEMVDALAARDAQRLEQSIHDHMIGALEDLLTAGDFVPGGEGVEPGKFPAGTSLSRPAMATKR